MTLEFLDYVEDILDAMGKAEILLQDVGYDEFAEDFRINFAVVRALEIVGEATKRLPMSLREEYPGIPWRGMAGLRDRIVHEYDTVDMEILWAVVKNEIPHIRPQLQQILSDHSVG
ncbi:MAG TPA: DUF86 domain-containing protein [Anaerolineae bacterium]|nr:DUF86 domain-containing protein [Anaerolineae bacterium]